MEKAMVLDETMNEPDSNLPDLSPQLALIPIWNDYSSGQNEELPLFLFDDEDVDEEDMDEDENFDDMDEDFDDDFDDDEDDFDDDYEDEDEDYDYEEDVDYDDFDE